MVDKRQSRYWIRTPRNEYELAGRSGRRAAFSPSEAAAPPRCGGAVGEDFFGGRFLQLACGRAGSEAEMNALWRLRWALVRGNFPIPPGRIPGR